MKRLALIAALAVACLSPGVASAQNVPVPVAQACGSASPGSPAATLCSGAGVPVIACATGSAYIRTDVAGVYLCTATNTWAQFSSGGAQVYAIRAQSNFTNTSTPQNTWATVGSPSITTTTSSGAVGAWLVHVTLVAQVGGGTANANSSVCIEGTNAGTSGGGDTLLQNSAVAAVCNAIVATPTNPLAGNYSGSAQAGLQNIRAEYVAQYPNATTVAFTCQVLSPTLSVTSGGFCLVVAEPI